MDLERGLTTIRRTLLGVKGAVPTVGDPKSETSRRTIAIPAGAVAALRTHKAQQHADRLAATDG